MRRTGDGNEKPIRENPQVCQELRRTAQVVGDIFFIDPVDKVVKGLAGFYISNCTVLPRVVFQGRVG
jgi:hypothetical protein